MWFDMEVKLNFYGILKHWTGKDDIVWSQDLVCTIILCPFGETPETTMALYINQTI